MRKATQADDSRQMAFELSLDSKTEAKVTWDTLMSEVVKISVASSTGSQGGSHTSDDGTVAEASAERAYPHIYDVAAGEGGVAMSLIAQARQEVNAAIDAWSDADLQGMSSRLAQLAVTLAAAHRHTQFNESLGAAVSFIRRAALNTNVNDVNMGSLMLLTQSLNALYSQPMLTLDGATDLIEKLQDGGWNGQHLEVAEFVKALLGSSGESATNAALQAQHAGLS